VELNGQLHNPALYLWEKSPLHPFDGTLDGAQSRYGCCGGQTNLSPLPAISSLDSTVVRFLAW
jgi:hypothetical protein